MLTNSAHLADYVLFKTCGKSMLCQHIHIETNSWLLQPNLIDDLDSSNCNQQNHAIIQLLQPCYIVDCEQHEDT